jgi:hypothetical protein
MIKLTEREALQLLLDSVDYTAGACSVTEMVGAVLPVEVIEIARQALRND